MMDFSLQKYNKHKLPDNFVSIAVEIPEGDINPTHAAIIIRYKGSNHLYHYPGIQKPRIEENFPEENWYLYKIIDLFNADDSDEIGAFLQHCRRICQNTDITYGYILDGSKYSNGSYQSVSGLPEFGTCVGFCLNTLSNSIIDADYMVELDDWDDRNIDPRIDGWATKQASMKYSNLDWTKYNAFRKRITPLEYLCCSFIEEYPIRKSQVQNIMQPVSVSIQYTLASHS